MSYICDISYISVMALLGHCCVRNTGTRCLDAGIFLLSLIFFPFLSFLRHPHCSLSHIPLLDCSFCLPWSCPIPSLTPPPQPPPPFPLPLQLPISIVDLRAVAMSTRQHITMATGLQAASLLIRKGCLVAAWPVEGCRESERCVNEYGERGLFTLRRIAMII